MADRRWRLSAESITAVSAVVAALIALGVGVWENAQERHHNRLSVLPSLELVAHLRTADGDSTGQAEILVINEGVGPAVIDEVRIGVADSTGTEQVYRNWNDARHALERWGVEVTGRAELGEGTVMGVGRERSLVRFRPPATAGLREEEAFIRLLDQLRVTIRYHSIYGDEHRVTLGAE